MKRLFFALAATLALASAAPTGLAAGTLARALVVQDAQAQKPPPVDMLRKMRRRTESRTRAKCVSYEPKWSCMFYDVTTCWKEESGQSGFCNAWFSIHRYVRGNSRTRTYDGSVTYWWSGRKLIKIGESWHLRK